MNQYHIFIATFLFFLALTSCKERSEDDLLFDSTEGEFIQINDDLRNIRDCEGCIDISSTSKVTESTYRQPSKGIQRLRKILDPQKKLIGNLALLRSDGFQIIITNYGETFELGKTNRQTISDKVNCTNGTNFENTIVKGKLLVEISIIEKDENIIITQAVSDQEVAITKTNIGQVIFEFKNFKFNNMNLCDTDEFEFSGRLFFNN